MCSLWTTETGYIYIHYSRFLFQIVRIISMFEDSLDLFSTAYIRYVRRYSRFQILTKRLISEWVEFISDFMLYFMCVHFLCRFNRWNEADRLFCDAIDWTEFWKKPISWRSLHWIWKYFSVVTHEEKLHIEFQVIEFCSLTCDTFVLKNYSKYFEKNFRNQKSDFDQL